MNEQTTLHLPIQRKWYELIKSGVKGEEYREIKKHWISRIFKYPHLYLNWYNTCLECKYRMYQNGIDLCGKTNKEIELSDNPKCTISFFEWNDSYFEKFDTITLRNGYGKNAPTLVVECLGITVGKGNPDWGAPEEQVFIIKLGNILKES